MRQRYRGYSEAERKVRIEELERVLAIAEKWKNLLKAECEAEPQQAEMFEGEGGTDDAMLHSISLLISLEHMLQSPAIDIVPGIKRGRLPPPFSPTADGLGTSSRV